MKYFQTSRTVADYKQYRPDYFARVGRMIAEQVLGLQVARALDVGCGFGNSTCMLRRFAGEVIGLDTSTAMLAEAVGDDAVCYRRGAVERPDLFGQATFGLITASSAWHWFDQRRALDNFHAWLEPAGVLVLYNHWFTLQMTGNPAFAERLQQSHYNAYPAPPRNILNPVEVAEEPDWEVISVRSFDDAHGYNLEGFCHYLMSQSNVTVVTEADPAAYDDIYQGLLHVLAPDFDKGEREMMFRGKVEMYRRIP